MKMISKVLNISCDYLIDIRGIMSNKLIHSKSDKQKKVTK